eukprot:727058-Prorocentrum_minimum.AAC.1
MKYRREKRILSRVMRWLNKVLTVNFTVSVSSPTAQAVRRQSFVSCATRQSNIISETYPRLIRD